MRIAYADPPYIGLANYYPEKQEVDHQALITQLETYDAWALSCYSNSLRTVLAMCRDDVRVAAWVKPFASFKPGVNPAYCWEPVIFRPRPRGRGQQTVRDWISASISTGKHMIGAKPPAFCFWLFGLLGAKPDDEFYDLFPGTGVVTRCWESWRDNKNNVQSDLKLDGMAEPGRRHQEKGAR